MSKIKKMLASDRARSRFLIYGIIPVCILLTIMMIVSFVYNSFWERNIIRNYEQSLRNCSNEIDNLFYEVHKTVPLLMYLPEMKDLLYSPSYFQQIDQYKATNVKNALAVFSTSKQTIHSVYFYKKHSNVVMTNEGSMDAESFFSMKQYSPVYSLDFYNDIQPDGLNRILGVSTIENKLSNRNSEVIPVVNFVTATNAQNLLVVNIDTGAIAEILERNLSTQNSSIIMLEQDGSVVVSTQLPQGFDKAELYRRLDDWMAVEESTLQTRLNGKAVLIVKGAEHPYLQSTNYQFIAVIPLSDMRESTAPLRYFTIAMIGVSLFAGIWTSLRLQGRLYRPIRELLDMLKRDDAGSGNDEFKIITSQINRILLENTILTDDVKAMLPAMQDRYIMSLLNANEMIVNDQLSSLLKKHRPSYRHPYFCVALTTFRFTEAFQKEYSEEEKRVILNHLPAITATVIPAEYDHYILNMERYTLCIVLNVDTPDAVADLDRRLHQLSRMFHYDKEYIRIQTGIGSICESIENINISYREALSAFSTLNPGDQSKTALYHSDDTIPHAYSITDNNRMINYLLVGNRESAIALLEEVLERNNSLAMPEHRLKEVLLQVFNTAILSLHGQGMSLEALMGDRYVDLFYEINTMDAKKAIEYLRLLLGSIAEYNGAKHQKPEMEPIKQYIIEHFSEDIYLQELSERFGIQTKYLSRLLKEYLSMTFMQYLSTLRIDHAKALLVEGNSTLDEIALAVGYNSRNTFIRMFKKMEGITPTEYRKMSRAD